MSQPKIFIKGMVAKRVEFDGGGQLMTLSIKRENIVDLCRQLELHASSGYVNLKLTRKAEDFFSPSGKLIATHDIEVDQWRPDQKPAIGKPVARETESPQPQQETSDVPF